jgi:hypothetical protein
MSLFAALTCNAEVRTFISNNGQYILNVTYHADSTENVLTTAQNEVLWIRKFAHLLFLRPQISNSGFVAVPGCNTVFLISPANNMVTIEPASSDTLTRYWGRDAYCGILIHCFSEVGDHYLLLSKIRSTGYLLSFDPATGIEQWRASYAYPDPRIRPSVLWSKRDRVVVSGFGYDGKSVSVPAPPPVENKCMLFDATNGKIIEQYSVSIPSYMGLPPIWHEGKLVVYSEGNVNTYDIETGEKGQLLNLQSVLEWLSDSDEQKAKYVLTLLKLRPELFSVPEDKRAIMRSLFPNDAYWQHVKNEIFKQLEWTDRIH